MSKQERFEAAIRSELRVTLRAKTEGENAAEAPGFKGQKLV